MNDHETEDLELLPLGFRIRSLIGLDPLLEPASFENRVAMAELVVKVCEKFIKARLAAAKSIIVVVLAIFLTVPLAGCCPAPGRVPPAPGSDVPSRSRGYVPGPSLGPSCAPGPRRGPTGNPPPGPAGKPPPGPKGDPVITLAVSDEVPAPNERVLYCITAGDDGKVRTKLSNLFVLRHAGIAFTPEQSEQEYEPCLAALPDDLSFLRALPVREQQQVMVHGAETSSAFLRAIYHLKKSSPHPDKEGGH